MVNEVAGITFRADSRDVKTATKDLDRMTGAAGRSEKAATRMARGVRTAFAALGAGLAIRAIIRNTVEQERVTAQLNATLRSTGRFSQETSDALRAQAAALQDVTAYGDEAVIGAQNILLTFRRIGGEAFPRATEATLDLATAMGTDLKSAAIQVGKALEDPATQMTYLSRAGITFTQQQKDMVRELQRAGDLAGAQAIVLKELETQFGGSARAARDTFGGALQAVANRLNDLTEADAMPAVTDALNDLEATLNSPEVKAGFQVMTSGLIRIIELSARAVTGFAEFGQGIGELFARFSAGPTGSLDAITQRISELRHELEAGNQGGFTAFERVLGLFSGPPSEERRRQIEAEIARLEDLRTYYEEPVKAGEVEGPDLSGLTLKETFDPITVDVERLRDSQEYLRALKDLQEDGAEASEELRSSLNSLAADMGGPVVSAGLRLSETMASLDEYEQRLIASNQLSVEAQQQLASARALATQQYEREIEAIEAQISPAEQLIERLRLETELIGLSNVEREKRIALQLAGADATDAEIAEIQRLIEQKARLEETERAVNELRDAGTDALASFIDGSKSASEAFESFADQVIADVARMLAEKAIAALFGGGFGDAPGGEAGGLFGTIFGSIFGPGRALGGAVQPGRIYPVTERGEPEVLTIGRERFLLTGEQGGQVQPVTNNTTHYGNTSLVVNLPPEERRRSASALASTMLREAQRAQARNR